MTKKTFGILSVFVLFVALISIPLSNHVFAQNPVLHKALNNKIKQQSSTGKIQDTPFPHKKSKTLSDINYHNMMKSHHKTRQHTAKRS